MADVESDFEDWSATAGSNKPAGGTAIGTGLDDNLRQIQATIRQYLGHKGGDIASGATVDLATATGFAVDITGTTTITALGTVSAGRSFLLQFDDALTFTHNGTSLIIPGGANITTAAGDMCMVISLGSGNWQVPWYVRADGRTVGGPVFIKEQADADADVAGYGQVWVDTNTPNHLYFTDDAGTDFRLSSGTLLNRQVFTANGTWTPTAGTTAVLVTVVGGGGGGGAAVATGAGQSSAGTGGGAGGASIEYITSGLGATETVTIGAGGAGGTTGTGSNGGTSSFGSHCSATGGAGGASAVGGSSHSGTNGAAGGIGSGGDINIKGGKSQSCHRNATVGFAGFGGDSILGSGGIAQVTSSTVVGSAGSAYGGGGSGGANGSSQSLVGGGAGHAGIVIVEEYIV
jgi:hypothetical protein